MAADFYQVLGVDKDASMQEIKKAYRKLARELHPDVVGSDPKKVQRFQQVTEAYEVLSDPNTRGRYDRRFMRRTPGRMAGGFHYWSGDPKPDPNSSGLGSDPANDLDLDDIFGDSDFGFGGRRPRAAKTSLSKDPNPAPRGGGRTAPPPVDPPRKDPRPGTDISMAVDVPRSVAAKGGTVTLNYVRLVLTEDRRGVVEYDEIHDLKVPPGIGHGQTLRVPKYGHAGEGGGAYGDLVCDIRLVGPEPAKEQAPPSSSTARETTTSAAADPNTRILPISVHEALLGGRVPVKTHRGEVILTLPPCTSGGARFRLRGQGEPTSGGVPTDLVVQLKIVTPPLLDDEAKSTAEKLAGLAPYNPRES